jgi:hypothetical protein
MSKGQCMIEIACSCGGNNSKIYKDSQSMQEVQFVV